MAGVNLDKIWNYSPRELLQAVQETPYPWMERVCDATYPVFHILKKSVKGFFERVTETLPTGTIEFFSTQVWETAPNINLVTAETINDPKKFTFDSPDGKKKLQYVLDKTTLFTKQAGIEDIKLYIGEYNNIQTAAAGVRLKSCYIHITSRILTLSEKEIDFILAHEIGHLKHNDAIKHLAFDWAVFVIEVVFLCTIFLPYAALSVVAIEAAAHLAKEYLSRRHEEGADAEAMNFLKSNEEALAFFSRLLRQNYQAKHTSPGFANITPFGNARNDYYHPPLTERLVAALDFRAINQTPRAEIAAPK